MPAVDVDALSGPSGGLDSHAKLLVPDPRKEPRSHDGPGLLLFSGAVALDRRCTLALWGGKGGGQCAVAAPTLFGVVSF